MSNAQKLRSLLASGEIVIAPGAYDGLTAHLVELAGFPLVYATGAGISNSQYALADLGLVTMSDVLQQVQKMVASVEIPVVCDVDTGYGNAVNLYRTVKEFIRAGASAVQIEDQVLPKKCGHFEGKQIEAFDESVLKIKAAVEARGDSDLVIIARTDAIAVEGFEEAVRRAKAYHAAGADVIFVEAPRTREQMVEIGKLPGWQVANIVEGGHTPITSISDLRDMGFNLVLYANLVLRSSVMAIQKNLAHLKEHGDSSAILDRLITMEERGRVTRKPFLADIEKRFVTLDR